MLEARWIAPTSQHAGSARQDQTLGVYKRGDLSSAEKAYCGTPVVQSDNPVDARGDAVSTFSTVGCSRELDGTPPSARVLACIAASS
jgi:hypothetical protein